MNQMDNQLVLSAETLRVGDLAKVLFSAAKLRWAWAIGLGYSAVLVAPAVFLLEYEKWLALAASAVVSFFGTALRWWSDTVRNDADRLRRMHDISVGLGHAADKSIVADIDARCSRIADKIGTLHSTPASYFDHAGPPSPHLLISNMSQSSWFTAQLANTAKCFVYTFATVGLIVPFCFILADSMLVRAYGITICVVVLMDMFYLGSRYGRLSTASNTAFGVLSTLARHENISERQALLAVNEYHFVRRTGPLIPDALWRIRKDKLNAVWKQMLSGEQDAQPGSQS